MLKLKKQVSIRSTLLISILGIIIFVAVCLIAVLSITGVYDSLNQFASRNLSKIVTTRAIEINRIMNSLSQFTVDMCEEMENRVNDEFIDINSISELMDTNPDTASTILTLSQDIITKALQTNSATGIFIILDHSAYLQNKNQDKHAAIFIRDENTSSYLPDNSGLLSVRGSNAFSKKMDIALGNYWTEEWTFNDSELLSKDFYYKPYEYVKQNKDILTIKSGYWASPFYLIDDMISVITYTVPLRDINGNPYGVIGIELNQEYLLTKMNHSELYYADNCFYLLSESTSFQKNQNTNVHSGSFAKQYLQGDSMTLLKSLPSIYGNDVYEYMGGLENNVSAIISKYSLNLYYEDSPFYDMKWTLSGIVKTSALFEASQNLKSTVLYVFVFTIFIGTLLSFLLINYISKPIIKLAKSVRSIKNEYKITLDRTNTKEIDLLADSIEMLSHSLLHSATLFMDTIKFTDTNIGIFEVDGKNNRVFITELFFKIYNLEFIQGEYYIPIDLWNKKYNSTFSVVEEKLDNVFIVTDTDTNEKKWYELKIVVVNDNPRGIIIDTTEDILEKKYLEYERDIDPLTKLLNRRAFHEQAEELVKQNPDKIAIMMFIDLDNLKSFNDTYGHDVGDLYICAAADIFRHFSKLNALVSRISGDEFNILMFGDNEENILSLVHSTLKEFNIQSMTLPNGTTRKVRFSLGYSWYPKHTTDLEMLVKYADFAMFEVKHNYKGSFREFNMSDYTKTSYLLNQLEAFNFIIENNLIKFYFQPIVDLQTGEIFAYEALMRPQHEELDTPHHLIQMATKQAKLYQIEKLTYFNVFKWLKNNCHRLDGKLIFFNCIPNQELSHTDIEYLDEEFKDYYQFTVTEITENEICDYSYIESKSDFVRSRNGFLAVDDFGSGYSNDLIVLRANPDFLKIDMSLIRDIDTEPRKQHLVSNILSYCKSLNIKTLGEGVETYEELKYLIQIGIDYTQGFYLGKPAPDIEDIPDEIKNDILQLQEKH